LPSLAGNLPIHFIYWAFRKVDESLLVNCSNPKHVLARTAKAYNIKIHVFQEKDIRAIYGPVFSSWFDRCLKIAHDVK
jgi:hypothetical protein